MFDEVGDSTVMDGQVKLTRLLQYTCGSAKAAIRNCSLIGGESGYSQARDILNNRYGNTHLVSQRLITEQKCGKRVITADVSSMSGKIERRAGKLRGEREH